MSLASFTSSILAMMPHLREKHGRGEIWFEVVKRNGQVGLAPRVRR